MQCAPPKEARPEGFDQSCEGLSTRNSKRDLEVNLAAKLELELDPDSMDSTRSRPPLDDPRGRPESHPVSSDGLFLRNATRRVNNLLRSPEVACPLLLKNVSRGCTAGRRSSKISDGAPRNGPAVKKVRTPWRVEEVRTRERRGARGRRWIATGNVRHELRRAARRAGSLARGPVRDPAGGREARRGTCLPPPAARSPGRRRPAR